MTCWIMKWPCLKNSVSQCLGVIASFGMAHLSLEVFSLFFIPLSFINFLAVVRPGYFPGQGTRKPQGTAKKKKGGISMSPKRTSWPNSIQCWHQNFFESDYYIKPHSNGPEYLMRKIITQLLVIGRHPIKKKKKTFNLPLHSLFQYQLNQK